MYFIAQCHLCPANVRVPEKYNQVDIAKVWASNWEDEHISEEHKDYASTEQTESETET